MVACMRVLHCVHPRITTDVPFISIHLYLVWAFFSLKHLRTLQILGNTASMSLRTVALQSTTVISQTRPSVAPVCTSMALAPDPASPTAPLLMPTTWVSLSTTMHRSVVDREGNGWGLKVADKGMVLKR